MEQFQDFLWIASILANVTLDPSQPDTISWIWTSSGCYSTKSARQAQFIGAFHRFSTPKVWKAEPKCTMFSWLVLHGKILTTNRLAIRGWPHDPIWRLPATYARTVLSLLMSGTWFTPGLLIIVLRLSR
jgi:hypothetical protein